MANINDETRAEFKLKTSEYREAIEASIKKEKEMLDAVRKTEAGAELKKIGLCEEMIYLATLYINVNTVSVDVLDTKNNDALNDARKAIYKAIIYLEEIVTASVDCAYSEISDKLDKIANAPLEQRFYIIRKLGLVIRMLINAFGENTKWKWSFVEMQGRFAVVAKNFINWKAVAKDYFDPTSQDYDNTVLYVKLIKKLLDQSSMGYRDKYELSSRRIDDMRVAINLLMALRRVSITLGESDTSEELKKKILVWKEKMDADQKSGRSN